MVEAFPLTLNASYPKFKFPIAIQVTTR